MSIFLPDYYFNRITDIDIAFFIENKFNCVLLDVDNTLTTHGHPEPYEKVPEWINALKENNLKIYIVSNNTNKRVAPFAKKLGIGYIGNAAKPFSFRIKKSISRLNCNRENTVLIGDQLFTDILCGKCAKIKTVLVKPIEEEKNLFFKFKRKIENIFLRKEKIV